MCVDAAAKIASVAVRSVPPISRRQEAAAAAAAVGGAATPHAQLAAIDDAQIVGRDYDCCCF